jgi:hypothetical protein
VCSFVFAEKLDSKDNIKDKKILSYDIENITRDIVKEQVEQELDKIIDDKLEETEVALEKTTNEKMLAMGDYYDTIISEITKNHDEVMFLYGMLNDKEKDIKNTVIDVENVKRSINHIGDKVTNSDVNLGVTQVANTGVNQAANSGISSTTNSAANNVASKANYKNTATGRQESENIISQKNAYNGNRKDTNSNPQRATVEKAAYKNKKNRKKAVEYGKNTNNTSEKKKGVALSHEEVRKNSNNNQMILDLYNEGKSNIEIAKQLKLGMGEVRLVIDLYNNRK